MIRACLALLSTPSKMSICPDVRTLSTCKASPAPFAKIPTSVSLERLAWKRFNSLTRDLNDRAGIDLTSETDKPPLIFLRPLNGALETWVCFRPLSYIPKFRAMVPALKPPRPAECLGWAPVQSYLPLHHIQLPFGSRK